MIDVKEAVRIAKQKAVEILGAAPASLEEIEREIYKDRNVWSITLVFRAISASFRRLLNLRPTLCSTKGFSLMSRTVSFWQ